MNGAASKMDSPHLPTQQEAASEIAILGGVMMHPTEWQFVRGSVSRNDFGEIAHQLIFDALCAADDAGFGVSIATAIRMMADQQHVEIAPGCTLRQYIIRSVDQYATRMSLPAHIKAIKDGGLRRRQVMAVLAAQDAAKAGAGHEAIGAILAEAIALSPARGGRDMDVFSASESALKQSYEAAASTGISGLSYGISDLDLLTGGMQRGNLVTFAGRPGMGKSAFGVHIALQAAMREEAGVICTLEMTPEQIAHRMISALCYDSRHRVSYSALTRGAIDQFDARSAEDAKERLRGKPLAIKSCGGLSVQPIIAKIRAAHQDFAARGRPLKYAIVDHIHLIAGDPAYRGRKVDEISDITAQLKALANELEIPVIILAQLNRSVENRDDKRPLLPDLRESGSIEQDSDTVIGLYRGEYYLARTPEPTPEQITLLEASRGTIEIEILKQRQGPCERIVAGCDIGNNVFWGSR